MKDVMNKKKMVDMFLAEQNTVVPPNSRLIGSKKNPGIKRLNNSSKPFQPKVATK